MADKEKKKTIFDDGSGSGDRFVVLPWKRTLEMCWANVQHRMSRMLLTFVCIAVVVAFFMSSLTYQTMLTNQMRSDDVHVQAVLEQAGVVTHDDEGIQSQEDRRTWLMVLSSVLCLVGITNTILMSVTERIREIGTLKCLGALDSFIIRLFLVESSLIGVLGSVAGCLVGFVLAALQTGLVFEWGFLSIANLWFGFKSSLPISLGLGTILTVLASVYPTYVAARMKPVDAMRVEV